MHVLTVTVQSLFAEVDVAYVLNVGLKLVGGGVDGDEGDGVADELWCVESVSVSGGDVTAVVVGDTDVLQSIDVDISGDEDISEDVVVVVVVIVVVVVVMVEEFVILLEDGIDVTAVQKLFCLQLCYECIIFTNLQAPPRQ